MIINLISRVKMMDLVIGRMVEGEWWNGEQGSEPGFSVDNWQ